MVRLLLIAFLLALRMLIPLVKVGSLSLLKMLWILFPGLLLLNPLFPLSRMMAFILLMLILTLIIWVTLKITILGCGVMQND